MRFVYLPTLNVLIIFFNKSGSTLYCGWIENVITFLGVPYELKLHNEIDYIDFIEKVYDKKPKIYFFVRNPLGRVVTSFYWLNTFDIKSKDSQFPLDEFITYADNLEQSIEKSDDMHLLPQSWELIKWNNYINGRENSMFEFKNFRYDKRFFKGCEIVIVQIEKFQKNFDALIQSLFADNYIPSYNKLEEVGNHHYYKNSFGIIEELHQQKTNFEMMFSLLSYNFVESNLKKQTHHNNLYGGLIIRLEKIKEGVLSLNKINEILANESKWLGYDNSLILNMNRFI